jgi:hypothetical protein
LIGTADKSEVFKIAHRLIGAHNGLVAGSSPARPTRAMEALIFVDFSRTGTRLFSGLQSPRVALPRTGSGVL